LSQQRKQEEPIRPDIADPELNPELFEHHKFVVDKGQEIMRIDKFLMNQTTRSGQKRLCKS
jgi:23S rRNA pseudouridine1911/1915/1917 synthase